MKKFLIFVSLFCLIFSIMAVSAFALDEDFTGSYTFNTDIVFDGFTDEYSRYVFAVDFSAPYLEYDCNAIEIDFRYGSYRILYTTGDGYYEFEAYSDGWLDDSYRTIKISSITESHYETEFINWLNINEWTGGSFFYVAGYLVSWLASSLTFVLSLFFVNGSLTLFGVLSLIVGGIGLVFVLINVLSNFLGSRG